MASCEVDVRALYVTRAAGASCGVCLHSGRELAPARHTRTFLGLLRPRSLPAPLSLDPPTLVCAWCERAARAALRLHDALCAAARAHGLFARLDRAGGLPRPGVDSNAFTEVAAECARVSALLGSARAATALHVTDVLIVDSAGVQWSRDLKVAAEVPGGSSVTSVGCTTDIETVVLTDDEDPPAGADPAPAPAPPHTRLIPLPLHALLQDTSGTGNTINRDPLAPDPRPRPAALLERGGADAFTLHPVMRTSTGALAVPSLNLTILNHQLSAAAAAPAAARIPAPSPARTPAPASDDVVDVDSILKRKVNELERCKVSSESGKRGRETSYLVDLDMVENEIRRGGASEGPAGGARGEGASVVKAPLLKAGKIDWEDKIPMDVISFMDATDPHAEALLPAPPPPSPSPFGFITNVRSGEPGGRQDAPTAVIDLC